MKLDNGKVTYYINTTIDNIDDRIVTPFGRKVVFTGKNINGNVVPFEINQILTVKDIYVGMYSSTVEFVEYPDKHFNTVMFEDI